MGSEYIFHSRKLPSPVTGKSTTSKVMAIW